LLRALQRAPQDPWHQEGLANLYEALGDLKRAVGAHRKVHEFLPHDFCCNLQLGRLLGKVGQPAEGEPLLRQATRQRPGFPDVWAELGSVQMAPGKYAPALEAYERAAKLKPREASYVSSVALALAKVDRHAQAITTYRRVIQIRPEFQETHFELAGELVANNQLEEAAREYAEAIRLNPRHAVSHINFVRRAVSTKPFGGGHPTI
jgi:tetratricopeptide (TPR) repeat protein